jgi:outer membrane autotransporter protein
LWEEGYHEDDAGILNLDVHENSSDSLQQTLGLRAKYEITCKRVTLTPQVRLEWLHEYQAETQSLSSRLRAPGGTFAVTGQDPSADATLLDVGVDVDFGKGLSLQVFYEWFRTCSNDAASHTLSTGLRYEF